MLLTSCVQPLTTGNETGKGVENDGDHEREKGKGWLYDEREWMEQRREASHAADGDNALVKRFILRPRFRRCCSLCRRGGRSRKGAATVLAVATAANLRVKSMWDVVPLEKAAKVAQARLRDLRVARLWCFGGSLAVCLSLDHDLQRPTSSAVAGARRILACPEVHRIAEFRKQITRPKYGFKLFSAQSGPWTEGGIMYFRYVAPQVQTGRWSWNFAKSFKFVTEERTMTLEIPNEFGLTFGFAPLKEEFSSP
ncbi:hypothetical protein B0H13DRAFT_1896487 [Mycena leptocephala]|nr:hypothetical protein B0H13DRAFT_1896487 [Mycena leptocephala]